MVSKFQWTPFWLPPNEIHRMTGLPPKIVWTMTYSHRPHYNVVIVRLNPTAFRIANKRNVQILFPLYMYMGQAAFSFTGIDIWTVNVWVRDGASAAHDLSVSDEQKAVFLVSVSDCSECDSLGLDRLKSTWSISRLIVWESTLEEKMGHSLTARKAEFLEWQMSIRRHLPYTLRTPLLCLSATVLSVILRVWIWILETQVGASLVWKSTWQEKRGHSCLPFKKVQLLQRQVSLNCRLARTPRVPPPPPPPPSSALPRETERKKPLPLAFCQLPKMSGLIIWPNDDRGGKHNSAPAKCRKVVSIKSYAATRGRPRTHHTAG